MLVSSAVVIRQIDETSTRKRLSLTRPSIAQSTTTTGSVCVQEPKFYAEPVFFVSHTEQHKATN